MIRRPLFAALAPALMAAAAPALAEDPRIQTRIFDEAQVVPVIGRVKVQTTIKFAPDEAIENVAIGDSTAWQVTPNRAQSMLFVKPLEPAARTNLTVVTDKRTYLFDLVANPRGAPLYVLQFRYPDIEKAEEEARLAAAAEAAREAANPLEMQAATDRLAVVDPARLNFDWAGAGQAALLPDRTYDDGDAVFLTWPAGRAIPAILTLNEEGDEGPVNYTVRGDVVVVEGVPAQLVLRSGNDVATLTNTGVMRPKGGKSGRAALATEGS
ncbi:MAG: TrbG/VirB9 family P-type conjugative transfer protein [Erythrobacter sp.]